MENKAINQLVLTTVDSLKNFKRTLGSTALATTLVATSIFTGIATGPASAVNQGSAAKNSYSKAPRSYLARCFWQDPLRPKTETYS